MPAIASDRLRPAFRRWFDINLGNTPGVGSTTVDVGVPPAPSTAPSTNPLFLQAEAGVPANEPSKPSQFDVVLAPFVGAQFGTGIGQSFAGIGPLALLALPNGHFLVSGGGNRGALYEFDQDGGDALVPVAQLDQPIFDMAFDASGGLWATSGGGALLELDPTTYEIVNRYGDSITQSLAFDAATGMLYVSSGAGIERFDPVKRSFTHFSDMRVDDLAVAPGGTLWGSRWPQRGQLLTFDARGRAQWRSNSMPSSTRSPSAQWHALRELVVRLHRSASERRPTRACT